MIIDVRTALVCVERFTFCRNEVERIRDSLEISKIRFAEQTSESMDPIIRMLNSKINELDSEIKRLNGMITALNGIICIYRRTETRLIDSIENSRDGRGDILDLLDLGRLVPSDIAGLIQ